MLQFSSDGCSCAVTTAEGRVKIWDTLKNTLKHDIGPFKDIRCVCFLADSKESLLGFGTADSVVVFDCSRGENYVVLPVTSGAICMCWSEGGSSLFTGHLSGDVLQWSVEDKQLVRKLTVDASPVRCVSVCPNNRYILTASRAVKLWRIRKSKQMNTFKGHIKEVKKLCFIGKDHTHFLSVGEGDRVIQVWSEEQTTPLMALSCDSHVISFDSSFSTGNDALKGSVVAACEDGTVVQFKVDFSAVTSPLKPNQYVQYVEKKQSVPVPILFLGLNLVLDHITVAYGSLIKPIFEGLDLPFEKEQTILIREVPTNLLLSTMRTQRKKSEPGKVTITGPVPKQEKTSSEAVLEDLVEGPPQKKARQTRPSTESLSQLIVQAVTSQDGNLLESALSSQGKERTIRSTVEKLPSSVVLPFIAQLIEKIEVKPSRCTKLLVWIRNCLTCHMTYLSTVPMATGALGYLEELSAVHLSSYERLCRLHGKLDVLLSRISQSTISSTSAFTPLLVHEIDTDDKLTDDDESDWSDSEGDSQSNQGEESLESDELLSND